MSDIPEFTQRTEKFPIDCTGDAVQGDRVRFVEAVFGGSWRKPVFEGRRVIEAEIVNESYGQDKQQHTFSLRVTASEGVDPVTIGKTIRRKGRNLYRNDVYRAPWADEGRPEGRNPFPSSPSPSREAAREEKHSRGSVARARRDERIAERDETGPSF